MKSSRFQNEVPDRVSVPAKKEKRGGMVEKRLRQDRYDSFLRNPDSFWSKLYKSHLDANNDWVKHSQRFHSERDARQSVEHLNRSDRMFEYRMKDSE